MSHGSSEVRFRNHYGHTIFVAYMRRDDFCKAVGGTGWVVKGWIKLSPGETEYRANPTNNQWFYYYAEAVDGAFWAGSFVAWVSTSVFTECVLPPSYLDYPVGMRELDTVKYAGVRFIP
jgi:uncharacterized membrane protein